jgi:hypothetical protein
VRRARGLFQPESGLGVVQLCFVFVLLGVMIYYSLRPLFTDEEGESQLKMILYFKGVIFEREMHRLSTEVSMFRDMYGYFPGDCPCPDFGRAGNGNGRVEVENGESAESMRHLLAAFPRQTLREVNTTEVARSMDRIRKLKVKIEPEGMVFGSRVRLQWVPLPGGRPDQGAHYFVLEKMDRGLAHSLDEKNDDGNPAAGLIRYEAAGDSREVDLYLRFRGW